MRVGIAHHYGWAVAVTATPDHEVVDRRRIELVEPGLPAAPIHHEGGAHEMHRTGDPLRDDQLAELVRRVRASVMRTAARALDQIATAVGEPIASISVRAWPVDFPVDVGVLRRPPYESRADSVMYCQILAEAGAERGWAVDTYDAKTVIDDASAVLGERADDVLSAPRRELGPPWTKDHRLALAATVLASATG
jgi:hypothetical protein